MWLGGLIGGVALLLCLTPLAYRGGRVIRAVAWPLGLLMSFNALQHLGGSLYMGRPLPGVYSSPLLLAASLWLLWPARMPRS